MKKIIFVALVSFVLLASMTQAMEIKSEKWKQLSAWDRFLNTLSISPTSGEPGTLFTLTTTYGVDGATLPLCFISADTNGDGVVSVTAEVLITGPSGFSPTIFKSIENLGIYASSYFSKKFCFPTTTSDPVGTYTVTYKNLYVSTNTFCEAPSAPSPSAETFTIIPSTVCSCSGFNSKCEGYNYITCDGCDWLNKGRVKNQCNVKCLQDSDCGTNEVCSTSTYSCASTCDCSGVDQTKCIGFEYFICDGCKYANQHMLVGKCGVDCIATTDCGQTNQICNANHKCETVADKCAGVTCADYCSGDTLFYGGTCNSADGKCTWLSKVCTDGCGTPSSTLMNVYSTAGIGGVGCIKPPDPQCPTCPASSEWTDCVNNKQYRQIYACNIDTNYKCVMQLDTKACETPCPNPPDPGCSQSVWYGQPYCRWDDTKCQSPIAWIVVIGGISVVVAIIIVGMVFMIRRRK